MPQRPPSPCAWPGCGVLVARGRCEAHTTQQRVLSDQQRGSSVARGYGRGHNKRFRPAVLRRDRYCRCDLTICDHGSGPCLRTSVVADHWPLSRRELVERGMDADDPRHGRGLCEPCDKRQTARRQPGGWHARSVARRQR
jgi:5-methylcytosine-specific restriction protein A